MDICVRENQNIYLKSKIKNEDYFVDFKQDKDVNTTGKNYKYV